MKMLVFFRRRSDISAEAFRDYYEGHHAPLARRLFPYIADYRRNYIRRDLQHRRASGEAINTALDFDVITEITFVQESDYQRMLTDMSDPVIQRQVIEDEERFIDRSATLVVLADEEPS